MVGAQLVGLGFALLAAISLAVQSLAVRLATGAHRLETVVGAVFAVNLLVLLPLAAILAPPVDGLTPVALLAFAAAGLLGSLLARACYFLGIARLGASRAEPLKALFPLVAVAMAVLVLGERVSLPLLLGVALLVGGGVLVAVESRSSPVTATGRQFWIDLAFPLAAAALLGIDPVVTTFGFAEGASALVGVTVRVAAAAAGFGLYLGYRALRGRAVVPAGVDRWLVVAGVANTGYLLSYYAALTRAPVAVVTPVMGISTALVAGGAALFLQREERVTPRLLAAAVVVVAGVAFVVRG